MVSEGVDYENENAIVSDDDDNHFLGKSINPSDLQAAGIHMEEEEDDDKPCVYTEQANVVHNPIPEPPEVPCKKEEVESQVNTPIYKVDVDESEQLAKKFGILSIPTMIIFVDGIQKEKITGLRSFDDIIEILAKY